MDAFLATERGQACKPLTDALNAASMDMYERHSAEILEYVELYGTDQFESLEVLGARQDYERALYWDRYWKDYQHCIPD
jgi:hypothetical protein